MNKLLSNIVYKQKAEVTNLLKSAYVQRDIAKRLTDNLNNDIIKVIIGPRRAGKSSLALQTLELQTLEHGKFAYLNFEDEELNFAFSPEEIIHSFDEIYKDFEYILFDEIQLLKNWEVFLNRLQRLGKNIIITGSNSKLLSTELASSLTGRYLEFQLLPFSYAEYNTAKNIPSSQTSFIQYLIEGGFPSIATKQIPAADFLNTLWDAIVLKDLAQRYKIRRLSELKSLLYLLRTSMASRVSTRSLERALNNTLSHSTISKYISWSEGAYLCCCLQNYSHKPRQRVNSEKKVYLYDNGFYSSQKISAASNYGQLLENYVFIELCRHGLTPNLSFFSYNTKSGYEVDFYTTPSSGKPSLIQVAYSALSAKTEKRETRALIQAGKELGISNLYILTCDDSRQSISIDNSTIEILPIWQQGAFDEILS